MKNNYLIYLHFSVFLLGLSGVIGKFVEVPAFAVSFGRVICSVIILLGLAWIKKENIACKSWKDLGLMIVGGAVIAIHWTSFFHAIQVSTVAIGLIAFSTFPFFLTFLEPLFFREKMQIKNVIASVLLLVAVWVTVPEFSLGDSSTEGVIWGMVASFSYAILVLINRLLVKQYSGSTICIYEHSTAFVVLLPFMLSSEVIWKTSDVLGVALLGIVCTAFAYSLFVSAQKYVNAQIVGLVTGLETVYAIGFSLLFLGEIPSRNEIIGGIMIVCIVSYLSLDHSKSAKTTQEIMA